MDSQANGKFLEADIEGKANYEGEDKDNYFERKSSDTIREEDIKAKMITDGRLREEGSEAKK